MAQQQAKTDLSEVIAENFGANATYVETLLARFRSDPSLVDESWQAYFEELIGGNGEAANDTKTESTPPKRTSTTIASPGSKLLLRKRMAKAHA